MQEGCSFIFRSWGTLAESSAGGLSRADSVCTRETGAAPGARSLANFYLTGTPVC